MVKNAKAIWGEDEEQNNRVKKEHLFISHSLVLIEEKMKQIIILLFLSLPLISFAQDPRAFNHGTCIVKYRSNNAVKYYLTWSSSYNNGWEHDIYNSIIYFAPNGDLMTAYPDQTYIGTGADEAQEPVNSAINNSNNKILTVWEDGNANDAPNVRGQLHFANGTIIKANWNIAGGLGSQHSANTAHLGNKYLIFYADEAPPATGGAVVKAKIIDDITGNETQSINFTSNDEDHWWPVSVSNTSNTRVLVVWGNDGYAARGTVLYQDGPSVMQTGTPQDYLTDIQQYYYQVEWLENISKFILIARNGAYENITDESKICLIDTLGNLTNSTLVNGGIIREAKMSVKWNECNQSYAIFYPSGINSLTQIFIDPSGIIIPTSNQMGNIPELSNMQWTSTGVWSEFVEDINGNDLFDNKYIALFVMNDVHSNNIIKIPVQLDSSLFCLPLGVTDTNYSDFHIYPSPFTNSIIVPNEYINFEYQIFAINGQIIAKNTITKRELNLSFLNNGIYLIRIKGKIFKIIKMN